MKAIFMTEIGGRLILLKAQAFALREVMPEKRQTEIFVSQHDGNFITNDWGDCLSQLKINAKERLDISL